VAGTTINYTFYCDRRDAGTDITPDSNAKFDTTFDNPKTAYNVCDSRYAVPGTYTAKVIAENGSTAAQDTAIITVNQPLGPSAPSVTTTGATSVTQASASLNMLVDPNGATTNIYFEFGPTTSMALTTNAAGVGSGNSSIPASISVTGLACNTTYYYRARASNSAGAAVPGSRLSFTTSPCGGGGGSQTVQLVNDPSFEAGPNAWWVATPAFYIDGRPIFPNPRTGNNYAFLSNPDGSRGNNLTGGMISPSVTIPSTATNVDLRFWYSITSDETTTSQVFDKLEVYLVRPGNQLTLITTLSNFE